MFLRLTITNRNGEVTVVQMIRLCTNSANSGGFSFDFYFKILVLCYKEDDNWAGYLDLTKVHLLFL